MICPNEHTVHHDQDGGEHIWVTCGDDVLDERVFVPSRADLSHDFRHFVQTTMSEHEKSILCKELLWMYEQHPCCMNNDLYNRLRSDGANNDYQGRGTAHTRAGVWWGGT